MFGPALLGAVLLLGAAKEEEAPPPPPPVDELTPEDQAPEPPPASGPHGGARAPATSDKPPSRDADALGVAPLNILSLYGAGAGFSCAGVLLVLPSPLCLVAPASILPALLAACGLCTFMPLGQGMAMAGLARWLLHEDPDFLWTTVASYVACWGLLPFVSVIVTALVLIFVGGFQAVSTGQSWPYSPIPQQPPELMLGLGILTPPAVATVFALAQPLVPAGAALLTSARRQQARQEAERREEEAEPEPRKARRVPLAMAY